VTIQGGDSVFTRTPAHLDDYRLIRKVSINLNTRLAKSLGTRAILMAADALGMLSRAGAVMLNQESDTSYLMDFAIYELRDEDGKNAAQRAFEIGFAENDTEQSILEGMASARLKLVEMIACDAPNGHVRLQNLIQTDEQIELTDIGMSRTNGQGVMMERIISVAGFHMTSGVNFPFHTAHRAKLLKLWNKSKKSSDRYLAIYEFYLRKGIATLYV
jgi:hypothetical protein